VDEDIQKVIDKADEPTETFTEYHAFLEDVTGLEFDIKQVILSMRLYGKFQAHNRETGGTRTRAAKSPGTTKTPTKAASKPATEATPKQTAAAKRGATKAAAAAKPAPKSGRRGKPATDPEESPF
jgi:hypothetical protein